MKPLTLVKQLSVLIMLSLFLVPGGGIAAEKPRYQRTVEKYQIPDVTLINQSRQKIKLLELLETDKPILLDFIYGTCTTICPILSAGFSNMQRKLGEKSEQIQLISFTIDPEYDTPEVLAEYLEKYQSKPGWDFFTGTREDIDKVMHAFDAFVPDKMSHYPIMFLRAPDSDEWVRIYGLIGTAELMREYQQLLQH